MSSPRNTSILETVNRPYRYIKVIINGDEIDATNISNGSTFPVQNVTIELCPTDDITSKQIKLEQLNKKSSKIFEFIDETTSIEFCFSENKTTTTLPKEININLVRFFKEYKPEDNKDYSCLDFAHEIAYGRGKYDKFSLLELNIDSIQTSDNTCSEENLPPGKIIYMYKSDYFNRHTNFHYALYLGQSYYLSLFGSSGPLIVSSINAMKKGFLSESCVVFEDKIENKNIKYLDNSYLQLFGTKHSGNDKNDLKNRNNQLQESNLPRLCTIL